MIDNADKEALTALLARVTKADSVINSLVVPNTQAVMDKLSNAETINRAVEANAKRATAEAKVRTLDAESKGMTDQLEAIEEERRQRISAANFPVEGLGFSDSGVTYRGLPFRQASTAQQLRISVAVAVAMNPKLRVFLVRDGSLLDEESMAILHSLAKEHDCQLWIEDRECRDPATLVIEDGAILGAEAEE